MKILKFAVGLAWLGVGLYAQVPPRITGIADEHWTAAAIPPGKAALLFGSGLGATGHTRVMVGGAEAKVLSVSGNMIRAQMPADLAGSFAAVVVSVDGNASEPVILTVLSRGGMKSDFATGVLRPGARAPVSETVAPAAPKVAIAANSGVVYTCDSNLTTLYPTICNTLNTTIAGLYSKAFTNVTASIYIQLGNTGAGMSQFSFNGFTYNSYRNALVSVASDATDNAALAGAVPATAPYSGNVELVHPLQLALGLSSTRCLASASCYDGTITISNTLPLYFRTGTITGSEYDFFTIAEHETDEILGTASCLFGTCKQIYPPDLFRYHSDHSRGLAAGENNSCASSDTGNACFSLDGSHMLQQYNNINGDGDAGDWVPSCNAQLVQNEAICAGIAGVDISPSAEILVLDAIGYTLRTNACDVNQSGSVTVADAQKMVNEALGAASPTDDVNGDRVVNVVDLQIVVNAVLTGTCS